MSRTPLLVPLLVIAALGCNGYAEEAPVTDTPEVGDDHAVVLQYHFVAEGTPRVTSVTPAEFEAHLDHLSANGYTVRPLPELVTALRAGGTVPTNSVAITFDDAYVSVYDNAFPLLKARGLPFTIFVNTEPVDSRSPAFTSWDQLREMHAAGATIANHSVSHPYLVRRPQPEDAAAYEERLEGEIDFAEARIEAELGVGHRLFAYPFGEYDDRLRAWLAAEGYIGIGQHSGAVHAGSDFPALPRFPVSGDYADPEGFAEKIDARGLPVVAAGALVEPTLATREARPTLSFEVAPGPYRAGELSCYATGQGRVEAEVLGRDPLRLRVRAPHDVPAGRSRYNCTAPHESDGSWFWFSHPWLRDIGPGTPP